ncbi:PREDICTED: uncharacterized protein LOC107354459 [Acropora digitifera]|uniref:uncharacterized protein LOC107354459 n=1 Tax=Acropora digitifera TaxID=70779 RepID=UPI00077AAC07|nr:PREDICTED: uncharacterized protein LOC107354459 [Acropora digitifera]
MISSRCFRSISNLSSPAKLVRHASRIQRLARTQGLTTQSSLSGRSTTVSQFLTTQSPFGRRFTRSLYSAVVVYTNRIGRKVHVILQAINQTSLFQRLDRAVLRRDHFMI